MSPVVQICLSASWGGQEMVALDVAETFVQNSKCESMMVTVSNAELEKRSRAKNIRCLSFKKRKYFHPQVTRALRKLAKENPSAVFMCHQLPDLWIVSLALAGLNNRLIGFSHTFVSYQKKSFFYKMIYSRADQFIVLTQRHLENFLQHHAVEPNKIQIIPNSVDLLRFNPSKKSNIFETNYGATPTDFKIIVVGRLDPEKGQKEVVDACALMVQKRTDFQIYIAGTDTLNTVGTKKILEEKIAQLGVEKHVHLLGHKENVAELLASADLKIMPSYGETFGRVIIEAMASGCPVLATNAGGVPSIIQDGENGFLCEPKSAESLANKTLEIMSNPDLRKKVSTRGLEDARTIYDKDIVTKQIYKAASL